MVKRENYSGLISLKELKKKRSPLYAKTMEWVRGMDKRRDHEHGPEFYKWVQKNLATTATFDTYIMINKKTGKVVAMSSILPDDTGAGKEKHLPGIWLGGVNVRRRHRERGIGGLLVQYTYPKLIDIANKKRQPIRVNLFANNPIAIRMYEKYGFKKIRGITFRHYNEDNAVYYTKVRPQRKQ